MYWGIKKSLVNNCAVSADHQSRMNANEKTDVKL